MNLGLMKRRIAQNDLLYDAEIEYLQSTGTQYIDTLVIPIVSPRVVIDVKFTTSTDADCFGFASNTIPSFIGDIYQIGGTINGYYRYYNTVSIPFNLQMPDESTNVRKFHIIDASNNVYIDGTQVITGGVRSFASNQQSIRIFKGRPNLNSAKQIRTCQIYDGDVLMRDFIPVRVGNIGYMYDKVSDQLFGNGGTGNFILGPDK